MQKEIDKLIGKDIKLCGQTQSKQKVELFSGKLSRSYCEQDKYVVGDRVIGPTFSFAFNQLLNIDDNSIVVKFCMR